MKDAIKRILCVIYGHEWLYSGFFAHGIEGEKKQCERCGESNLDRIFE